MTPHSANELTTNIYLGTSLVNGQLCHRWLDGTVLPIIAGGAGDDDDGGGDDDGDDGGSDADADAEEDDDDDTDKSKAKKKKDAKDDDDEDDDDGEKGKTASERRAWRQAAARRIGWRDERVAHGKTKEERDDLKVEVADLKKNGAGDEKLKTTIAAHEKKLAEQDDEIKALKADKFDTALLTEITDIVGEMNIVESPKKVKAILREFGYLAVGDDGELDKDLTRSLKRLVKEKELTVKKKNASGDDEEEDDESGAPSRSSGSPMRRGGGVRTVPTEKQLAKKYPALTR